MITRMMPPAMDSEPVEKCSSLASSSPSTTRTSATTPAVVIILPDDLRLRRAVDCGGDLDERHERDLRPDADQQQQEGVDDEIEVDRGVVHRSTAIFGESSFGTRRS